MADNIGKKIFQRTEDGFQNRPKIIDQLKQNVADEAASIITTRLAAKYITGARCVLKINDKICGFAFNVGWNIRTEYVEISEIDNFLPVELAPKRVYVDGYLKALRQPLRGPVAENWQANILGFLSNKYIALEVRDSVTDALLFYSNKIMITGRSEDYQVDQLGSVSLTWKSIGFIDEAGSYQPT